MGGSWVDNFLHCIYCIYPIVTEIQGSNLDPTYCIVNSKIAAKLNNDHLVFLMYGAFMLSTKVNIDQQSFTKCIIKLLHMARASMQSLLQIFDSIV